MYVIKQIKYHKIAIRGKETIMEGFRILRINERNKYHSRLPQTLHIVDLNECYCDGTQCLPPDECADRWESERDDADWDDLPDLLIP